MTDGRAGPIRGTACMVAYANYYTDARIKNYVEALLKRGYEVDVFALGTVGETPRPGLRTFSVMNRHWGSGALGYVVSQLRFAIQAAALVARHHLQKHYRLVHVHNIPDFVVFSALVPKLTGAKVILDVHDPMPESFATKFDLTLGHPLAAMLRLEERLSARFADQVITTNELHKAVLVSHGIPVEQIEIILNVANEEVFRPVVGRSSLGRDELTLGYHGTIAERLGIDLILSALRIALKDCPNVRLQLIGDGDFLPTIRSLVSDWGLASKVSLLGFIPVNDLPEHLSEVDVGIIGNRAYTESKRNYMLPVKMLEYAAMEIPTIAPRLRTITSYFDEESALFYTPDDPADMARRIREVYYRRESLDDLKQHLRVFNKRHNWRAMEGRYLGIVDRLLGCQTTEVGR